MVRNSAAVSFCGVRPLPKDPYRSNCKFDGSLQDSEVPGAHVHASSQLCFGRWVITEISHGNRSVLQSRALAPESKTLFCPTGHTIMKQERDPEEAGCWVLEPSPSLHPSPPLLASMPCFSAFLPQLGPPRVCDARCWHLPVLGSAGWVRPNLPCARLPGL